MPRKKDGFIWGTPPGLERRPHTDHGPLVAAMKSKPGQWAMVGSEYASPASASSMANSIRVALSSTWAPRGSFEAVSRKQGAKYTVWARYVGEPSDE